MTITEELDHKKVLIWGYGREGKSTEAFCKTHCQCEKLDVYEGKPENLPIDQYDLVLKSPGIPLEEPHEKITSQTQLFLSQFSSQIIGITGTKGKSTTSSMLYQVLKECSNRPVLLVGNIGYPCFDYVDEITEDTIIVYELSCHQLHHVTVSPHIAVFLNLYEEHLDYYHTLERYFEAKQNIMRHQSKEDYAFLGNNVPVFPVRSKVEIIEDSRLDFPLKISGTHNQKNAYFVYLIAVNLFGLEKDKVIQSMSHFDGLPHRMEYVGTYDGVRYYDDSISTIPEAAIQAAKSIKNVQTLLIGGMDRGIDYSLLVDFIKKRNDLCFVCMYETGERIYKECSGLDHCFYCEDLQAAVKKAKEITRKDAACILSPAAPSYKYFKNFEERGDVFQTLVKQ